MNHPSSETQKLDWGALIMGLFLALGFVSMLLLAAFLFLLGISVLPGVKIREPLSILILAGGVFASGILVLPGLYFNVRRLFNQPEIQLHAPPLGDRIIIPTILSTWLLCLALGQISTGSQLGSAIVLPVINILAVGLPILLYLRISLRGLKLPSARRAWSLFGASLIISPTLAFILEGLAVVVIVLLYALYARFLPGLQDTLKSMLNTFQSSSRTETDTMRLAAKLLFAPGAAFTVLVTFSLAVPLIEETSKTILIWPLINRIRRPVEGFVLGTLCGAAFALAENIGFASTGSADWTINVATRATAALPHMLNSGILGWALVSAWKEHRYGRLAKAFLAVILIHGIWNAASLGLAMNSLADYAADVPFYLQNSYPWASAWVLLAAGAFGGLIFNNIQMRKLQANEPDEIIEYNSTLLSPTSGGNNDGHP
jgi:RsiW-degrading membrane proteinase PrsW (M82 family)